MAVVQAPNLNVVIRLDPAPDEVLATNEKRLKAVFLENVPAKANNMLVA